jgi:hypothetical protein
MAHAGTYQFFESIGNKSFAMHIKAPVPTLIFNCSNSPNFSGSLKDSNTLKCLIESFPGDPDFFDSIG